MLDVFIGRFVNDDTAVVTNNAEDVPVGTQFDRLCVVVGTKDGPNIEFREKESCSIDVVVRDISSKTVWSSIEVIPKGWSAAIRLHGRDVAKVRAKVERSQKGEYVHLQAAT